MCALAQKNRCHVTRWFNCNVIDKEFMKDTAFMGNISEQQNYALSQLKYVPTITHTFNPVRLYFDESLYSRVPKSAGAHINCDFIY